jgi:hypothetical protein
MGNDSVRFTLELPPEVAEALDEHCAEKSQKASANVGATVKIGRSKAIEAILRKLFRLPTD